jgi:hypothetical protein
MKTRRRLRRGGGKLQTTATVLALLPVVAKGEGLWTTLLSGKRLTDAQVQTAARDIVSEANKLSIPLPPSPLEMVATVLKDWTPPPSSSVPSSLDPSDVYGINPATAQWAPQAKVTVHSTDPDESTGFERTPVTVVSDDGTMVSVKAPDDGLVYPFPKSQIELRPVAGGRRRRRRKTLRRKM